MSNIFRGENLIFIVSQPRTGSTLLQRILFSHPEVHSVSEPWVMLPPIYALRERGVQAEYDHSLASDALRNFLSQTKNGEESYFKGLRKMYGYLYEEITSEKQSKYFLDKTPRYYLIIEDIKRAFPGAKFIVLFRHPLAVLASLIRKKPGRGLRFIQSNKLDLLRAPDLLISGISQLGESGKVVRYEDLVREPASVIQQICSFVGIEFRQSMIQYGENVEAQWQFGDQKKIHEYSEPSEESIEKWIILASKDPKYWRLLNDYLEFLGSDTMRKIGYSYKEESSELRSQNHSSVSLYATLSLKRILNAGDRGSRSDQPAIGLVESFQKGGLVEATQHIFRLIRRRLPFS
ncbi:hypothetical protein GGP77_002303 [Salinibacter ruber]|uniref:sulfotransferase family protein n=1 Tax=Salinibacter ruber TaxID=146919 RepID=UPI00216A07D2|nr:sulfotransferase [Salinibacter ruber]MCS3668060.1 hypothetical protein [Salinibacter ruber]